MEEQQQHIDEMFRHSLSDYRETPPPAVWDRIAQQLDADEDKKPKAFFLRWQWALLLLLLLGGSTWMLIAKFQHRSTVITTGNTPSSSNPSNTYQNPNTSTNIEPVNANNQEIPNSNPLIETVRAKKQPDEIKERSSSQGIVGLSSRTNKLSLKSEVNPANASTNPTDPGTTQLGPQIGSKNSIYPGSNSTLKNKRSGRKQDPISMNNQVQDLSDNTQVSTSNLENTSNRNQDSGSTPREPARKPGVMYAYSEPPPFRPKEELPAPLAVSDKKLSKINSKEKKLAALWDIPGSNYSAKEACVVQAIRKAPSKNLIAHYGAKKEPAKNVSKRAKAGQTVAANAFMPSSSGSAVKHLPVIKAQNKTRAIYPTNRQKNNSVQIVYTGQHMEKHLGPNKAGKPVTSATTSSLVAISTSSNKAKVVGASAAVGTPVTTVQEPKVAASGAPVISNAVSTLPGKRDPSILAAETRVDHPVDTTSKAATAIPPIAVPSDSNQQKTRYPKYFTLSSNLGFEFGSSSLMKGRMSLAMGLMWHISDAFAIGVQPAIRFGSLAAQLTNDQTYQQSATTVNTPFLTFDASPTVYGHRDTIYNYVVKQKFDSIIVSGVSAKGILWEIELPLLLSYQFQKNWNLYAGPTINLGGQLPALSGGATTTYTTNRKDSIAQSVAKPLSEFNNYFGPASSLPNYSNYQQPTVSNPASVRAGYLIGAGYQKGRLLFDASIRQQLTGYSNLNADLKKVYASPYIRIGIGYYLLPRKKSVSASKNN